MSLDLTATTAALAAATADLSRLLPGRTLDPVLAGLLLTADATGVTLAGTDRERGVRLHAEAVAHTDGQVLVPAKPLAETLAALDSPDVRLVVEGSRLAIRTPGGRFALPLLAADSHPGVPAPPAAAGSVRGADLHAAVLPVASAASRDDALPVFTGVRLRAKAGRLVAVATDRYRMAAADLPWLGVDEDLDVLIPAALFTEVAKQARTAERVTVHADADRAALTWGSATVTTAVLASVLPDEDKLFPRDVECSLTLDGAALAGAVRRVAPYAGARGAVTLETGDGELRVRGSDPQAGEAEETVKAGVHGNRVSRGYQAKYLLETLRWFGGDEVRIDIQPGIRGTMFSHVTPGAVRLRYLVVPLRQPN
ncbi:DNA polymerase III subunit beta [Crossiella sp. SN42]|uniref:DNA polymerase III subunit beta n=1 Tax=Crossiella sp. SN42 TaxID=2944808 RepID=UPI00207D477E|nr:DNA polymerase III subunit beta [Crossiella sp. SN42]MCO1582190.1 DNA polymerase III subunit beta [Crossiella sp. SN42]